MFDMTDIAQCTHYTALYNKILTYLMILFIGCCYCVFKMMYVKGSLNTKACESNDSGFAFSDSHPILTDPVVENKEIDNPLHPEDDCEDVFVGASDAVQEVTQLLKPLAKTQMDEEISSGSEASADSLQPDPNSCFDYKLPDDEEPQLITAQVETGGGNACTEYTLAAGKEAIEFVAFSTEESQDILQEASSDTEDPIPQPPLSQAPAQQLSTVSEQKKMSSATSALVQQCNLYDITIQGGKLGVSPGHIPTEILEQPKTFDHPVLTDPLFIDDHFYPGPSPGSGHASLGQYYTVSLLVTGRLPFLSSAISHDQLVLPG